MPVCRKDFRRDVLGRTVEPAVIAAVAAWLGVTLLSQHPNRLFDRFRKHDPFGVVIPDWRFFAPEPARHDMHLLYRVLTADRERSAWAETNRIRERDWLQTVWFPERRRDKALFDLALQLIPHLGTSADVTALPVYRVLREFVAAAVRRDHADGPCPRGFQFMLVRGGGYDGAEEPEYLLVSPYHPLGEQ
ncbi:hypothetical protein ACIHFE_26580 [Streptomyces sp. NPDC052396]|uniref:hypothetical protein n=1 Tax=Streptomyces sp. NPDC052396 TaxID=3365689 RepID=UPI0037CCE498